MTDVRITEIRPDDRRDAALLRQWWEVGEAGAAERPVNLWPAWEVTRAALALRRSDVARSVFVAVLGDRVVAGGDLQRYLLDNRHLAEVDVQVHPRHRRRGLGRAVLAELERQAAADGRSTLIGVAHAPVGGEGASSRFAAACGYAVAIEAERKVCDLTTASVAWPGLDRQVAAGLGGYSVVGFEGSVPQRWVDDFCRLLGRFMTEVPTGELDLEQGRWTPERLHEHEERMRRTGRAWLGALGLTPEGRACGFTELSVVRADPRHGHIGGTLVLPEHRGHRLGLGMKLHTHRRVVELFPGCGWVETDNAGVNAPMNAVNEALGYRTVERSLDVQKVLTP